MYQRQYYTSNPIRTGRNVSSAVKWLLIINCGVYIIQLLANRSLLEIIIIKYLALIPLQIKTNFYLWQFVTYMFLHGSITHILFNMLALWLLGTHVERHIGKNKFLMLYFLCGTGAGIISFLANTSCAYPTLGASAGVLGVLTAFAFFWPNQYILLYFIIPIKVKWLVIGYAIISYFMIPKSSTQGIAHLAHLSGIVISYLFLLFTSKKFEDGMILIRQPFKIKSFFRNLWHKIKPSKSRNKEPDILRILKKVDRMGINSLTPEELDILKKESERRRIDKVEFFH